MIVADLRLEPVGHQTRRATAWLISGDDVQRWIEEIAAWKIDERQLRLFLLPQAIGDSAVAGVFVISPGSADPMRPPAGLAFGALAPGFYVPIEAEIRPVLDTAEIARLRSRDIVVLHPALGPLAFSEGDGLSVSDLLDAPPEREAKWAAPPVEIAPAPRITSISFRLQLSLQQLLDAEAGDIGSDGVDNLPPADGEPPTDFVGRNLRKLGKMFRPSGKGAASGAGNAFERMEQWAKNNFKGAALDLAQARSRALLRLLDQLGKDPDAGLKHALPLGGSSLHRGLAKPGSTLGSRPTDFSLGRLGGGRAADFWDIPPDVRQALRQKYLELAERERHLGRHRRAAYIHAELLGDMLSAARVLVEGECWQEAAIVYRDHLRQPLEAAKCFVKARLIAEAVQIYETEGEFESLGELYRSLGDEEKAVEVFRQWVEWLRTRHFALRAAEILQEKLGARDEALALLESAWPASPEARACIERWFVMRGTAGEHAEASRLVGKLAAGNPPGDSPLRLLQLFAWMQKSYPDRSVRLDAEDQGRALIAATLASAASGLRDAQREILRTLPNLAPDDRLLHRDVQRFVDAHPKPPEPVRETGSASVRQSQGVSPAKIRDLDQLKLPAGAAIAAGGVTRTARGICVVSSQGPNVELSVLFFDGKHMRVDWTLDDTTHGANGTLLTASRGGQERVLVAPRGRLPFPERQIPQMSLQSMRIGGPSWLGDRIHAAAFGHGHVLWVMRVTASGPVISGFQETGQLVANYPAPEFRLPMSQPELPEAMIHLAVADQEVVYGAGSALYQCGLPGGRLLAEFDEGITALQCGPRWGSPHVIVSLESHLAICWLGTHRGTIRNIKMDLPGVVAGYSNDGTLVAISGEDGFLFDCDSRGRVRSAHFKWTAGPVAGIIGGPAARTFAVVCRNRQVGIFGFSPDDLK